MTATPVRKRLAAVAAAAALLASPPVARALSTTIIAEPVTKAVFHVGAAVESINPPAGVHVWSGGFGASPEFDSSNVLHGHDLQVRAVYISNGVHAVAMATADVQGWFASYQEGDQYGITDIRKQAAAQIGDGMSSSDIIVQATHTHSGPTVEGIWGPVEPAYLQWLHDQTVAALVAAAKRAVPSYVEWANVDAPYLDNTDLNETDSYPGWIQDGQVSALRAVAVKDGAPVAVYANVPAHPDIVDGASTGILTADYFGFARDNLEAQLGGVAVVGPSTLGREESPIQVAGQDHSIFYAGQVTNLIDKALSEGKWLTNSTVLSAETMVNVPADNPALIGLNEAWSLPDDQKEAEFEQTGIYPIDRSTSAPYATGPAFGTYLTVLRVGGLAFVSQPGEPFPEIRDALVRATRNADEIVTLSKGQDDLGYYFPAALTPLVAVHDNDHIEYNPSFAQGDVIIQGSAQDLAAVGFDTDPVAYGRPLPNNDYSKDLQPAVQAIASPSRGDVGPDGTFTTTFKAIGENAYLGQNSLQGSTVMWDFGDGTKGTSGYGRKDNNFVPHSYRVGHYKATVSGTDSNGRTVEFPVYIEAFPRLAPVVSATSNPDGSVTYRVDVSGGDGTVLAIRWALPDGTSAYGPTVTAAGSAAAPTVFVTDGTGTVASATL